MRVHMAKPQVLPAIQTEPGACCEEEERILRALRQIGAYMTDLFLGEESIQFRQLAQDFSQGEITKVAQHLDETGEFPKDLIAQAWQIGLVNTFIPEEFGGLGLSVLDSCVILEEIAAACPAVATVMAANLVAASILMKGGTGEQKLKYLSAMTENGALAGSLLVRSASGFCTPATAVRRGSGWLLSADNAVGLNCAHADFLLIIAGGEDGLSAFVIDANSVQLELQSFPRMGLRCADIHNLRFEIEVDENCLIGAEGKADELLADASSLSAPILAACAVGCGRAALTHSIAYSKERHTFGKPISSYQAVTFMLADMARHTEAARLLTWRAATLADKNADSDRAAILAWTKSADAAMNAACDAVQIFGGYGYSREYPVEKLMRDAKMLQVLADTTYDCKVSIGRELLVLK